MMEKQSRQIRVVILNINSMIPENPLLKRIKNCVNFSYIYEKVISLTGQNFHHIICSSSIFMISFSFFLSSARSG